MSSLRFVSLLTCTIGMMTASCLFDVNGLARVDAGGDGDGDTDADIEPDSDADVTPDSDQEGEPDAEEDADAFRILSVSPDRGFTTGAYSLPEYPDSTIVEIRYQGDPRGPLVVFFGEHPVFEDCRLLTPSDDEPFQGCIETDNRTERLLLVQYPGVLRPITVAMRLTDGVQEDRREGAFEFRLVPVDTVIETMSLGTTAAGHALSAGCFQPRTDCERGAQDAAIVAEEPNGDGLVRLLTGDGPNTGRLLDWSGATTHGPVIDGSTLFVDSWRDGDPPGLITIGSGILGWQLRHHEFDRGDERFTVDHEIACWTIPLNADGMTAGDLTPADGDEVVLLSWWFGAIDVYIQRTDFWSCFPISSHVVSVEATPPEGESALRPALDDLDNDGHLELFFATLEEEAAPVLTVLWGTASGLDVAPRSISLSESCGRPGRVLAIDIEGDGDRDLVVGCSMGRALEVVENLGERAFGDSIPIDVEIDAPTLLSSGFVDTDASPDLVAASQGTSDLVVLRGIGALEDPWLPMRGIAPLPSDIEIHDVLLADIDGGGHRSDDVVVAGRDTQGGMIGTLWMTIDL